MKFILILFLICAAFFGGIYADQKVTRENFYLIPRALFCVVDPVLAKSLRAGDVISTPFSPLAHMRGPSDSAQFDICIGTAYEHLSVCDSIRDDTLWFHALPIR